MNPPCKDCERKGCGAYHARCGKYLMWKHKKAKEDQAKMEEIRLNNALMVRHRKKVSI